MSTTAVRVRTIGVFFFLLLFGDLFTRIRVATHTGRSVSKVLLLLAALLKAQTKAAVVV